MLDDPVLNEVGAEIGATASQVSLAYLLAKVFWVIPSAGHRDRIQENFAAQQKELSPDHIARIDALDCGMRLVDEAWCPVWDE